LCKMECTSNHELVANIKYAGGNQNAIMSATVNSLLAMKLKL